MKKAYITGITGQDGSYLAELLLAKGYEVHGLVRRANPAGLANIQAVMADRAFTGRFFLHDGDMSDSTTLARHMREIQPDEVYNFGAQSHVRSSFDMPEYTADVVGLGCVRLLEALRETATHCKFYQASTSEMFGNSPPPQSETTPLRPVSPYAAAKVFAHHMTGQYRTGYGIFAVSGILFNHESARRGDQFVTRKITKAVAQIAAKKLEVLQLGNLDAKRDWGYAPEYVDCVWQMMQQSKPDDYVVATGESHSVKEFLTTAFDLVGLDWQKYVKIDPTHFRQNEVPDICGDSSKAKKILGWTPRVKFRELIGMMLAADLQREGLNPKDHLKRR